jgi:release factor glutamine methyltransferase
LIRLPIKKIGGLIRRLLRIVIRLLFEVRYSKRHERLCLERIANLDLLITPQVFNPKLFGSSPFLLEYLSRYPLTASCKVLDLGCGSGLLGIQLAKMGARVIATDINPQAVWVAAVNARLNSCPATYETRQGSLYDPVAREAEKFDLIVMNPPYYAHVPRTPIEQAFMAGSELEVLTGMLAGAAALLKPKGFVLAVVSSTIPLEVSLKAANQAGLSWQIVARRRYWAEWHLIYQLSWIEGHSG